MFPALPVSPDMEKERQRSSCPSSAAVTLASTSHRIAFIPPLLTVTTLLPIQLRAPAYKAEMKGTRKTRKRKKS